MYIISANNVNDAYDMGMDLIRSDGVLRNSRAGDVLVMDGPVTTLYAEPTKRVLFNPTRDANPFFHFMEGLWMLAGRRDVKWISQFNAGFAQFSDDGKLFHGAYGFRWVNQFGINQLEEVAKILKANPDDRRCVVQMWNAADDLGKEGLDFPCNTQIYFRISVNGELDMTVCNRSNDIIWGAYGANAVHMSMMQEVMAAWIGVPVGRYWQVSNNYHAYVKVFEQKNVDSATYDMYDDGAEVFPMVNGSIDEWFEDLYMFLEEGPIVGFRDKFFRRVVTPIWVAWKCWKSTDENKIDMAQDALKNCMASDWRIACHDWLERRR